MNDRPHGIRGVFTGTWFVLVAGKRLKKLLKQCFFLRNSRYTYFVTMSTHKMLRSLNYGFEHFGQWLGRGRRRGLLQRRRRLPRGRQGRLLAERVLHVEVLVPRLQLDVLRRP